MSEYTLTIAPDDKQNIGEKLSGSGHGELIRELEKTPLARGEYTIGVGKGHNRLRIDTSYLCRFDGTDLVQWYGRVASGYFVPFGRVMQIVKVTGEEPR